MIYFLSDLHGKINHSGIEKYLKIAGNDDLLIILGDLGLWFAEHEDYMEFTEWFLSLDKDIAFLDGNHEKYSILFKFPEEEQYGGRVRRLTKHIVYLQRGYAYNIQGSSFFVMGGCKSSCKWKSMGLWEAEEVPSADEIAKGYANLKKFGNSFDYILTHKYSAEIKENTDDIELQKISRYIDKNVTFKNWYSGHSHKNEILDSRHTVVFDILTKIE